MVGILTVRSLGRRIRQLLQISKPRANALLLASVILMSSLVYTAGILLNETRYLLSASSVQLIGKVNTNLAKKITLDQHLGAYRFNAGMITPDMTNETDPAKIATLLASQKQQAGGGGADTKNLYALDLPINPKTGTTMYDSNSKTSFKIVPEFAMDNGRSEEGRIVYPLQAGGQAVYSVKGNGVKEDIVLSKPRGDNLSFRYRLELPKSLTAKLDARGNLGIYGVDPLITSALASTSGDTARLKDIRENGEKSHLLYLIPAPTILQSGAQPSGHQAHARYQLDGKYVTIKTTGLAALTYPISIDPTVVVTSTTDFTAGNNEENISFDTGAISRAAPTGGALGTWSATSSLLGSLANAGSAVYNGYWYIVGGTNGTGQSAVQYAALNSNGTVGTWTATSSLLTSRMYVAAAAYNGYLYAIGGIGSSSVSNVQVALINADGTLGSWVETTALPAYRDNVQAVVYNGYLYVLGGYTSSSVASNTVYYAPLNADGTTGTWGTTTSFATPRVQHVSSAYNGYIYIVGGQDTNAISLTDAQYAPINSDGTIGTWSTTASVPGSTNSQTSIMYNGCMYVAKWDSSTMYYASFNADGTLGAWSTTSVYPSTRDTLMAAAYNGYVYVAGGKILSPSTYYSDVQYAPISAMPASSATVSSWAATTILGAGSGNNTAKATTRKDHTSVAYNGYVYVIGGMAGTTPTATVHYAPTNANGTLGAWTASANPLPAARNGHVSVMVNDYIYVIGGLVSGAASNTILYSQVGVGGANGTWTSVATTGIAATDMAAASYNGYIYVSGGTASGSVNVYYSQIGANGAPGTWTATTALPTAVRQHASTAYNGYLYVISGAGSTVVYYAPINSNGTVGTWNTTSGLGSNGSITDANAFADSGYLVADGFSDTLGGTSYVMYAKINTDGTLGAWAFATGSSYSIRSSNGLAFSNGYMYVTGGVNGSTVLGDTQYASLTFSRTGMSAMGTTATWQSATATNLAIYGQAAVAYNGFIYLVGGQGGGLYRNDVRYAPIASNGTIGTWTTSTSTMGAARYNGAAAAYNGYLYVTGGQQGASTFTNTTEYAPINADGSIGTWATSANTFTTARAGHTTAAYNGKLYVVGGGDAANTALGDVKYATINTNGTIGTWADTTATTAARDTDGFVYGGRVYILGGLNGTTYSNAVRYATINADGTLGTWTTSPYQFATARSRHAVAVVNGYAYLSGGANASALGDLQYAPINTMSGEIGPWKTSNSSSGVTGSPTSFSYHSLVGYKGKLYSLAGQDGSSVAQTASYLTSANVPSLSATYTQRINMGQLVTLNSIVATGTWPAGKEIISFRTAGANGVFGSWQLASSLTGTPLTNVRYVQYKLSLDDSTMMDMYSSATRSTVNDVTLDYSLPVTTGPTPDTRLRHNKYFDSSGVLQSLETP